MYFLFVDNLNWLFSFEFSNRLNQESQENSFDGLLVQMVRNLVEFENSSNCDRLFLWKMMYSPHARFFKCQPTNYSGI